MTPTLYNPLEVPAEIFVRIRRALKLKQSELAAKLGVARRTVIRWEQSGAKFDRWMIGRTDHWSGKRSVLDLLQPLAKKAGVKLPKVEK